MWTAFAEAERRQDLAQQVNNVEMLYTTSDVSRTMK